MCARVRIAYSKLKGGNETLHNIHGMDRMEICERILFENLLERKRCCDMKINNKKKFAHSAYEINE